MTEFSYTDFDRDIWDRELADFVPAVLYDMHAHMWSQAHAGEADESSRGLRLPIDLEDHLDWAGRLYPGREIHYLMLATPVNGMDVDGHNRWLAGQMSRDARSGASLAVTPAMAPEHLADEVTAGGFVGLKPYRTFADDPAEAAIRDFLPEAQIEVADHLGLCITLHLSKRSGVADPANLRDLEELTGRYPRVLAGCARGKYITYGRAWQYYAGSGDLPHCDPRATLVIYEQLRQEKQVADMLNLTQAEIEAHFSGNGARLLELLRVERNRRS